MSRSSLEYIVYIYRQSRVIASFDTFARDTKYTFVNSTVLCTYHAELYIVDYGYFGVEQGQGFLFSFFLSQLPILWITSWKPAYVLWVDCMRSSLIGIYALADHFLAGGEYALLLYSGPQVRTAQYSV